jgi:CubicO group peptidase (beta-lactamase class C family)
VSKNSIRAGSSNAPRTLEGPLVGHRDKVECRAGRLVADLKYSAGGANGCRKAGGKLTMGIEVHGFCEAPYQLIKDAFAENFDEGLDLGASLSIMRHGRPVADLWAGYADIARTRPWEKDTVVCVMSATKLPLIIGFLMLVDRGLVDLDATVATYWPEFGVGGKDRVTVREAMTHRDGVPGFEPPISFETHHDWEATTANIAAQTHWFGGDNKISYHPVTYGFVLGEIMRRVDGRRPAQFVREEIAERAGIDIQIGLQSKSELARVAEIKWPPLPLASDPPPFNPEGIRIYASSGWGDRRTWERMSADISAGNGYANGHAMAKLCSIFAQDGELDGVRYLSKEIVDEALSPQASGEDWLFGPVNLCLGFSLDSPAFPAPTPSSVHWGGMGGAQLVWDRETGLAYGFAMNQFEVGTPAGPGPRFARLWKALTAVMNGL